MRPLRSELLICLILCLVTGFTYAPAMGFPFVSIDDLTFVVNNPMVNQGLQLEGLQLAFTRVHSSNWIPLTWLSHAADVSLFGLDAGAHHAVNLALHLLNACLFFLVMRRMTAPEDFWKCAVVAALFALHPAHVETVAWVSERKGALSTTFWWLATWAYLRHVRQPCVARLAAVAALMALGLLAKAMLISLPFALLLLDLWPLRRFAPGAGAGRAVRLLAEKLPLLALSAAAVGVTVWAQSHGPALQSIDVVPLGARFANAVLAPVRYLGTLFWPVDLSPFYPLLGADALAWVGPAGAAAALLLVLTALALRQARARPHFLVGWLWFLGTLVPVIGLVQVGVQSIADRYTYIPYVGLFIVLVWGVPELCPARWRRATLAAVVVLALLTCGALSRGQLLHWRSSLALWKRAVEAAPSAIAHAQLAHQLLQLDRLDEALAQAQRGVEIDPESPEARHNLGAVLLRMGRSDAAGREFSRVLEIDPDFAPSQLARALILHARGSYGAAADLFEQALTQRPDLQQVPDYLPRYQDSLRLELVSRQVGFEEALEDHRRALALRPGWLDVTQNLAWLLATHPQATPQHGRESVVHALRVTGGAGKAGVDLKGLDTLAAAHAAAGDYEQAVGIAEQALERAEAAGYTLVVDSIRARLELYRSGRPYRETPLSR
jgi:tetratricopeptide (TPR) repeat protein